VCSNTYGYINAEAKYHNQICLPGCDPTMGTECPNHPYMTCLAPSCTHFRTCESDNGCRRGELCYHGGFLRWAGGVGECLACELGCDCKSANCPCVTDAVQKRCLDRTSPFSGIWSGSYGGAGSGTWEAMVETDGSVRG
jgi:hypothetical protein